MRIGIVTFHSQINYGGVLQCLALQASLREMGHDAVVIDLWMHPNREGLDGVFARHLGAMRRLKMLVQSLLWPRMLARQVRHWRTMKFVERNLRLTDYSFLSWDNAPRDLGVDLVVVGSDQVWHCGDFGDPRPYLLEGAPAVRAIAYAASYGIPSYPVGLLEVFRRGLRRFAAISVREKSAMALVEQAGAKATHVLDPTLLVRPGFWQEMLTEQARKRRQERAMGTLRRIVCYFIRQDIEDVLPDMERFARRHRCRFDIITTQMRPHVNTRIKLRNYILGLAGAYPHVHLKAAAGPQEFLHLFATADASITDSFHALMFSSIYDVNCRVLSPKEAYLKGQFARLEEFANYVDGPLVVEGFSSALESLGRGESIDYRRSDIDSRRQECQLGLEKAIAG